MNVLKAMGIQQWRRRSAMPVAAQTIDEAVTHDCRANDAFTAEEEAGFEYSNYDVNMGEPVSIPDIGDQVALQGAAPQEQNFAGSLKGALNKGVSGENLETKDKLGKSSKKDEKSPSSGAPKKVVPLDISDLLGSEPEEPELVNGFQTMDSQPISQPQPTNEYHLEQAHSEQGEGQFGDGFHQNQEPPQLDDNHFYPDANLTGASKDSAADEGVSSVGHNIATLNWQQLDAMLETNVHCPSCGWGNGLLGVGDQQANWMFVIDAPNSREIEAKTHFVGRSGQLFDVMLSALGLERSSVYCTSIFKCAPTDDLSVTPQCDGLLQRQIDLVAPKVIISFGEFAAQSLLKSNANIENLRQSQQQCLRTKTLIIPTFGPAEMLDDTVLKSKVWGDLKKALSHLAG